MSQPPNPPQGGEDPLERSGPGGWNQPPDDQPTQRLARPS